MDCGQQRRGMWLAQSETIVPATMRSIIEMIDASPLSRQSLCFGSQQQTPSAVPKTDVFGTVPPSQAKYDFNCPEMLGR
jgi:hypothetical protein